MKETRIGILGNVDSGKSTIISVLKEKILDNGRGLARQKILKHQHEKDSGRTSSITHHYYTDIENNKVISFIDLAGHEKYYKTTIFGVNGSSLDYIVLMIGSNMGVTKMTIEHLTLILILKIPFIVVFSKSDLCPKNIFNQTFNSLTKILKRYKIYNELKEINSLELCKDNYNFKDKKIIPYFKVSNVTGDNIEFLRNFILNINEIYDWELLKEGKQKFIIEDVYYVNGVGLVVSGTMVSGIIQKTDKLMIGPFNGIFHEVQVKSIHNNYKTFVDTLEAGKSGCFNIKSMDKKVLIKKNNVKRGMILLDKTHNNHTYMEFEAKIKILHHPTTIKNNYEAIVHCGSIKQIAKITHIEKSLLRTGDSSIVKFKFKKKPEFIQENKQIIFREGQTKGIGFITKLIA
tara:strand:+ start:119 stop:1327 length:1209 start_codon:yes stop_codon:yes gene_type:complete